MNQKVVGIFANRDSAAAARTVLLGQGIAAADLRLSAPLGQGEGGKGDDGGIATGVRGFLSEIFGVAPLPETGNYSEALRRGHFMLVVALPEGEDAGPVRAALAAAGAIDVDVCFGEPPG